MSIPKESRNKSLDTCLRVPACQIGGDWCQRRRSSVRTHLPKGNNCHWHLPCWWKAPAILLPCGEALETGCTKDWPLCAPLTCPPWKSCDWHDESSTLVLDSQAWKSCPLCWKCSILLKKKKRWCNLHNSCLSLQARLRKNSDESPQFLLLPLWFSQEFRAEKVTLY